MARFERDLDCFLSEDFDAKKEAAFNARFDVKAKVVPRHLGEKTGTLFIEPTFAELLADLKESRARRELRAKALVKSDADDDDDDVEILSAYTPPTPPAPLPVFQAGFDASSVPQILWQELDGIADGSGVDCLSRSPSYLTSAVFRHHCGLGWVHRRHLDADSISNQLKERYQRNPSSALRLRCGTELFLPGKFVDCVLLPHALIRTMQIGAKCSESEALTFLGAAR